MWFKHWKNVTVHYYIMGKYPDLESGEVCRNNFLAVQHYGKREGKRLG
ncbi:MAG: hypothetical protein QXR42_09355 [Candidatus Bathyarchaeia archaeon]